MYTPIAIKPLANRVPGRLHLSLEGIETDPNWAERLERDLAMLPGLTRICASFASGSLLLRFDPKFWDADRIASEIGRILQRPYLYETLTARKSSPTLAQSCHLTTTIIERLVVSGATWNTDCALPYVPPSSYSHFEPMRLGLRLGTLCLPSTGPDPLSLAFECASYTAGLPVGDWQQQYRLLKVTQSEKFLHTLYRHGRQRLAIVRGEPASVIAQCQFVQDLEGCHHLGEAERQSWLTQSPAVAFAYRPLLFGQETAGNWILVALAQISTLKF
jgi:hypothetical protein